MPDQSPDHHISPHAAHMKHICERARQINRPKLIGSSPSDDSRRDAYIFTQAIRSDAERDRIPFHVLAHFRVTIHGSPDIPKSKDMAQILETAKSYIRASEATSEAPEIRLLADAGGEITLAKSKLFPYGFSFRFKENQKRLDGQDPLFGQHDINES